MVYMVYIIYYIWLAGVSLGLWAILRT